MPRHIIILSTILSLIFAAPVVTAAEEGGEHSPLHEAMEEMNDAYRGIGRALRRPDPAEKDTYLGYIQVLIDKSVESKAYVPARAESVPEAEREAFIQGYIEKMDATIATLQEMKAKVEAGEWEAADALFDTLKEHKSEGHEAYKAEED